jgi:hypothetical protein
MFSFVDAGVSDDVRERLAFAIIHAPISAEHIVGDSTGNFDFIRPMDRMTSWMTTRVSQQSKICKVFVLRSDKLRIPQGVLPD